METYYLSMQLFGDRKRERHMLLYFWDIELLLLYRSE